jgi:hypothetical protein
MAMAIFSLPPDQQYLTEKQVSELTGRAVQSLRNDRHNSKGFPYIKLFGHQIRYKLSDVLAAMEAHRIVPGGNGGAGRGGA